MHPSHNATAVVSTSPRPFLDDMPVAPGHAVAPFHGVPLSVAKAEAVVRSGDALLAALPGTAEEAERPAAVPGNSGSSGLSPSSWLAWLFDAIRTRLRQVATNQKWSHPVTTERLAEVEQSHTAMLRCIQDHASDSDAEFAQRASAIFKTLQGQLVAWQAANKEGALVTEPQETVDTMLYRAMAEGDGKAVLRAMKRGARPADPNARFEVMTEYGDRCTFTLIDWAIRQGRYDVADKLWAAGARLDDADLMKAPLLSYSKLFNDLIFGGADRIYRATRHHPGLLSQTNEAGRTLLEHLCSQSSHALPYPSDPLRAVLSASADRSASTDRAAWRLATANGNEQTIIELLRHGIRPSDLSEPIHVDPGEPFMRTTSVLQLAAESGEPELADQLHAEGAALPDVLNPASVARWKQGTITENDILELESRPIALYVATRSVPGIVNLRDELGRTLAHHIAGCGFCRKDRSARELVRVLLSAPQLDLTVRDSDGNTPVHAAAYYAGERVNATVVLPAFLKHADSNGFDFSQRGAAGKTVLQMAVMNDQPAAAVEAVLRNVPNPAIDVLSATGGSALFYAINGQHLDVAVTLMKAGASSRNWADQAHSPSAELKRLRAIAGQALLRHQQQNHPDKVRAYERWIADADSLSMWMQYQ